MTNGFRRNESGELEVMHNGVWTWVPSEARDEIDRLTALTKALAACLPDVPPGSGQAARKLTD